MNDDVSHPKHVNLKSGNIAKAWSDFKQTFHWYLVAIGKTKASSDIRGALLMGEAGPDALEVWNSFKDKLITKKNK